MADTVIRVENLGKKYVIGHQKQERYRLLRDVLAEKARAVGQVFSRNGQREDPTHEEFWALKDVSFEIKQGDRQGYGASCTPFAMRYRVDWGFRGAMLKLWEYHPGSNVA
jgi:hypothetical protein